MLGRLLVPIALLLLVSCALAAPYNFLDNYRIPAPAPEDGPPASFHASRDKALLPAQICGVVGSYLATVLIWGILLRTVGRRLRQRAEDSLKPLELTTVTQPLSTRSLTSLASATSRLKKGFAKEKPTESTVSSPQSPDAHSPSSFDQKIIDADRERALADMERLYAAVMDHDRKKSYSTVTSAPVEPAPNERQISAINTSHPPNSPVKAIYPPTFHQNGPREHARDQPPASPRSILTQKSAASNASGKSKSRFSLKKLRISSPLQRFPNDGDDEARTPLSSRFSPSGATPSPSIQQNSPTTPHDLEEAYEQLDQIQPLPRPAPQRRGSSQALTPTSPHPQSARSATSSSSELPLRGYVEPLKSPGLRTTVLHRRSEQLSLTTPKTGVAYTPYTPYMPFTPLTPVTPQLMTKKERKLRAKAERRKVQESDDMVQTPKVIFGDAW